jgi:hypothetical protein
MDFENLPLFGSPLEHVETYVYYDGRRTFSMRSLAFRDLYYLVNTVDDDEENGDLITLLVALDGERFKAVRSGLVDLSDAFVRSDVNALYTAIWSFSEDGVAPRAQVEPITPDELPEHWLPRAGVGLNLPTATVEPFEESSLMDLSQKQQRSIFAFEIESEGARITEFPVRYSGEFQVAVSREVEALAGEVAKGKSALVRDLRPNFVGVKAASFVLLMAIDSPSLVEANEITNGVFERLNALIAAVASGNEQLFLEELKKHKAKARHQFRAMLEPLANAGSGLAMSSVVAFSTNLRRSSATAREVATALQAIQSAPPTIHQVEVRRGVLTGLILGTRVFVVVDAAGGKTYRGHMDATASEQADGLAVGNASFVTAVIRAEVEFASEDEESGTKYFLESITEFSSTLPPIDPPTIIFP